jgi:hypothetical protein
MKKGILLLAAGGAVAAMAISKKKQAKKEPSDQPSPSPKPKIKPKPSPEYIVEDGEITIPDEELPQNYDDTWRLMQKALLSLGYNVPTNGYLSDVATQEALIRFKWDVNTVGYYASSVFNPTPSLSQELWIDLMKSMPDPMVFGIAVDLSVDEPTAQCIAWAREESPTKWLDLVDEARQGLKKYVNLEDLTPPPSPGSDEAETPGNYYEIYPEQVNDTLEMLKGEGYTVNYGVAYNGMIPADFKAQLMSFANHNQESVVVHIIDNEMMPKTYGLEIISAQTGNDAFELKTTEAKTILYWMQKFENEHIVDDKGNVKLPGTEGGGSTVSNIQTFLASVSSDIMDAAKNAFSQAYVFTHQGDMPGAMMMAIMNFAKQNPKIFVGVEDCQGGQSDRCGAGLYGLQVVDLESSQPIKTFNQIKSETALALAEKYVDEGF